MFEFTGLLHTKTVWRYTKILTSSTSPAKFNSYLPKLNKGNFFQIK